MFRKFRNVGIVDCMAANCLWDRDNAAGIGDNATGIEDNAAGIGDNSAEIGDKAAGIRNITAKVILC